ncbi:hypothetical protein [Massilimicrobiota sp. An134]|uniref:hypothetical protein n=1 Tax=Massilimicrobiota sp. An134 TaxID=1965557 RepID=UPI000B37D8CC|nr:hypothetical protein [Massilimicrobiota sp. An134]OUQ31094.1 hypothetical protein B5E79_00225 [Massilimicrobiota sp. An134]
MELVFALLILLLMVGLIYFLVWLVLSIIGLLIFGVVAPWYLVLLAMGFLFMLLEMYEQKLGMYHDDITSRKK